jgi:hypothetical protein
MNAWYILRIFSQHLKLLGPMTLDALKEDLSSGKVAFSDFVYQPQDKRKWVRAFEVAELLTALPEEPSKKEFVDFESTIRELALLKPLPPSFQSGPTTQPGQPGAASTPKNMSEHTAYLMKNYGTDWYLQFEGSEFGPFAFNEVGKILKSGEFKGTVLAWQEKLPNWIKIKSFEEFVDSLIEAIEGSGRLVIERGSNTRSARREVLVASVSIRLKNLTSVGICRDISEGGLQAYRLDAELDVGTTYTVSVIPLALSGVPPFTVHAKLMWANKVTKNMGFQFVDKLEIQTVAIHLKKATKSFGGFRV